MQDFLDTKIIHSPPSLIDRLDNAKEELEWRLRDREKLEGNLEDATFNKDNFLIRIKLQTHINDIEGWLVHGWWNLDENDSPIEIPKPMNAVDFPTLAHAMHHAGHFKSVGEAKRNGWDKPSVPGTFTLKKARKSITLL